jgi:hypothetical protein
MKRDYLKIIDFILVVSPLFVDGIPTNIFNKKPQSVMIDLTVINKLIDVSEVLFILQ